jgi:predicted MFS family arabinose efflux permease
LCVFPTLPMILAAQLVAGLSNLLVGLGIQTHVGKLGKGRAAERNFSTLTIFASIGQIGGPLIGGLLIGLAGYPVAFATAAAMSTACATLALVVLRKTSRSTASLSTDVTPRRALDYLKDRDTQLAILASCLMTIPEVLRTSFLPVYLGDVVHLDPALVGYVLAIFAVAGLVSKTALPRMVARFGRQAMLLTFTTACGLALLGLPLTASLWMVGVITAVMGLTFGLGRPLSMAMAANAATPGQEGFVVALRLSGNRLADFVLPIAFGSLATAVGIGGAFVGGGALLLLGAGALLGPAIAEIRSR